VTRGEGYLAGAGPRAVGGGGPSAILRAVTVEAQPSVVNWLARRSCAADAFPLDRLLTAKGSTTVSVVLPAREVADTIGPTVAQLVPLRDAGLLDELLVIDAASADGTAAIAERAGASVVQESEILAEHGPARGKGDALWRAVHVTRGDVVAFVDADSAGFDPRFALGLLGPLLTDPDVAFVKGAYRRPLQVGAEIVPEGGGRVTELLARPLLNLHVPELAGIVQPLAGEMAARRTLLEALPFPVGYGVEIALLIDALRHAGLDALAQVDLGTRRNAHQPLHALSAMAYAVLVAAERRVHGPVVPGPLARPTAEGALTLQDVAVDERPPLRELRGAAQP
jgi:glucosyl-3-phosphoglycerate synthase